MELDRTVLRAFSKAVCRLERVRMTELELRENFHWKLDRTPGQQAGQADHRYPSKLQYRSHVVLVEHPEDERGELAGVAVGEELTSKV